ncbi:AP-1 complex subunit sigma-2 isoform X3 [Mustela nigripes]|uniref:AP-1 complex subunit sigma-2 isoform X3 n=1 Tax=Mustela nigripes TaxID=77151 RepID=UPI0028165540|nr:AP-1 complex subunit sigma-2 isoform X3 [Mustela nigripes]
MQFMLLFSRQGKLRLQKWYVPLSDKEKKKITRELVQTVLARKPKMCSFLEWRDLKIVYKRYASLYFCCAIEDQDNELITLEIIHRYVELLDKYFGSVCELDIIFNFEKAYFILDEFLLGGEVQETSKKNVLKAIEQADLLQEVTPSRIVWMGHQPTVRLCHFHPRLVHIFTSCPLRANVAKPMIVLKLHPLGRLGGSVGWTTAFSSGHDPGVLGSSPASGSQHHGESASPSDLLITHVLSHCLSLK